mgnify:FL=1
MGELEKRLRETIYDLQEKHNEIVELGEESLRERDEYLAPLTGRLEEIDDEDIASIQNAGDYDVNFLSISEALKYSIDDDDAVAIQKAKDAAKQVSESQDDVNQTIESEPPHKLIDYDTSLSGDLDEVAMNFEDTVVETENNAEEFSEEISRIIQEMNEAW